MQGPDKISFVQRRGVLGRTELVPRRRNDQRLFKKLTSRQEDAFNFIEEAHHLEMAGMPISRMKYSERVDPAHDWEMSQRQIDIVIAYREWIAATRNSAAQYAVLAYMTGSIYDEIARRLKIRKAAVIGCIYDGLNIYCKLQGWGDQSRPVSRRTISRGYSADFRQFTAHEIDGLGRPVWVKENIDIPEPEHV